MQQRRQCDHFRESLRESMGWLVNLNSKAAACKACTSKAKVICGRTGRAAMCNEGGVAWQFAISKLRTTLGKFGEFLALIAYFWLAWVRHNHFVNTIFSKLRKEIADSIYGPKLCPMKVDLTNDQSSVAKRYLSEKTSQPYQDVTVLAR